MIIEINNNINKINIQKNVDIPVFEDLEGRYYAKPELGGLMVGFFENNPDPIDSPVDWNWINHTLDSDERK